MRVDDDQQIERCFIIGSIAICNACILCAWVRVRVMACTCVACVAWRDAGLPYLDGVIQRPRTGHRHHRRAQMARPTRCPHERDVRKVSHGEVKR